MVQEAPQFDFMLELGLCLFVFSLCFVIDVPANDFDGKFSLLAVLELGYLFDSAEPAVANLFAEDVIFADCLTLCIASDRPAVSSIAIQSTAQGKCAEIGGRS